MQLDLLVLGSLLLYSNQAASQSYTQRIVLIFFLFFSGKNTTYAWQQRIIIVSHEVVVIILQITHVRVRVRERGALDGFP